MSKANKSTAKATEKRAKIKQTMIWVLIVKNEVKLGRGDEPCWGLLFMKEKLAKKKIYAKKSE